MNNICLLTLLFLISKIFIRSLGLIYICLLNQKNVNFRCEIPGARSNCSVFQFFPFQMSIKKLLIVTAMILTTSVDRQMIKNVWGQQAQAQNQQKQCTYGLNTVQNIIGDQIPTIVLYENVPIKEYIDKGQRKR